MIEPEKNHLRDAARFFLKDPAFEFQRIDPSAPLADSLELLAKMYTLGCMISDVFSCITTMHASMAIELRDLSGLRAPAAVGPFVFRFEPLAVVCSVKGQEGYDLPPAIIQKVWEMRAHARGRRAAEQFLRKSLDQDSLTN